MLEVYWLNDYRTSKINIGQASKYLPNLEQYSKNKKIGLQTAIREAEMIMSAERGE